ncbi:MAG: hypothetical protein GX444_00045 [Myxococcales bacterium]|nr:hypothetical protein [Myxococcales bacterium]
MRCPNCNRKLPENQIECPVCTANRALLDQPRPIGPETAVSGKLPALAVGLIVAVLGAFGWDLWFRWSGAPQFWPAVPIGLVVGLAVRLTGGPDSPVKGLIGFFCGVVGIGGGVLLMLYHLDFAVDKFTPLADATNLAYLFVGLSLSRSLSVGKKKPAPSQEWKKIKPGA